MMEKEIIDLVHEQSILENHIEKTELWIEYLGLWQATIIEAMVNIFHNLCCMFSVYCLLIPFITGLRRRHYVFKFSKIGNSFNEKIFYKKVLY